MRILARKLQCVWSPENSNAYAGSNKRGSKINFSHRYIVCRKEFSPQCVWAPKQPENSNVRAVWCIGLMAEERATNSYPHEIKQSYHIIWAKHPGRITLTASLLIDSGVSGICHSIVQSIRVFDTTGVCHLELSGQFSYHFLKAPTSNIQQGFNTSILAQNNRSLYKVKPW